MQSAAIITPAHQADMPVSMTFEIIHTVTVTGKPSEFGLLSADAYRAELTAIMQDHPIDHIHRDTPVAVRVVQ